MKIEVNRPTELEGAAEGTTLTPHVDTAAVQTPTHATIESTGTTTPGHLQHASTTARSPRDRLRIRTKAKRARPRVLELIACLAYIVMMFTTLSIGLLNLSHFLTPRLYDAQVELRALGNLKYREQMLYTRLDKLLSTQLSRRFGETYEECLARSLVEANDAFFGLGFQYPEIRQPTVEWAMENCGRLLFTPQRVIATLQEAVLHAVVRQRWALGVYRARLLTEKFCSLVTSSWNHWLARVRSHLAVPGDTPTHHRPTTDGNVRDQLLSSLPAKLPFGFDLACDGKSLCRPVYTQLPDKATISNDNVTKSIRKVQELSTFRTKLNIFQHLMACLALFFVPFQVVFLVAYLVMSVYIRKTAPSRKPQRITATLSSQTFFDRWSSEENYAVISIAFQLLAMVGHVITERLPKDADYSIMFGLMFFMIGVTLLIQLFVPAERLENVFNIREVVKELYVIAKSRDVESVAGPNPPKVNSDAPFGNKQPLADRQQNQDNVQPHSTASASSGQPESLTHLPEVSLDSTVQEDLREELNALRQKHKQQAYVESLSEFESEEEEFVDLAGSITPMTTDVESGWSVVEA
ncbi:hypothetical protein EK21DRAFT_118471 [Setomelanomma holmii]|uniref:Uncharacterized protein n=1 Tax=Setomelanomma holmii TaxID=210430 RepID=A0A9P4GYB6_9PLEO|nr:hypothetical protein EK21DRAFT_118471 [Setomelanomma holmii]